MAYNEGLVDDNMRCGSARQVSSDAALEKGSIPGVRGLRREPNEAQRNGDKKINNEIREEITI